MFAGSLGTAWQLQGRPPTSLEELFTWSWFPFTVALIGAQSFFSLSRVPVGGRQITVKDTGSVRSMEKQMPVDKGRTRDADGRFS